MLTISKSALLAGICVLGLFFNKEVSGLLPDDSKVVYNVSEGKKLDGTFSITKEGKTILNGSYKDGERAGNWFCFNPDGTVYMRYNYTHKKLLSLDTARVARATVEVSGSSGAAGASIPVPVCSIDQYVSLLGAEFRRLILAENRTAEGVIAVELVANVDRKGKATYVGNYSADGVSMNKQLKPDSKLFNIEWLPAKLNGEAVAAVFKVNMAVDLSTGLEKQRFRWTNY